MTILFLGMSLVTIPEAARVLHGSPRRLPLFCLMVSGVLALAGVISGDHTAGSGATRFGHGFSGPIWRSTYPLVVPWMLFVIGQGIGFGVITGLHALAASRRSLRTSLVSAALVVAGALAGALAGGTSGTVWGTAVAAWISAAYGWWQLRVAHRESCPPTHREPSGRRS